MRRWVPETSRWVPRPGPNVGLVQRRAFPPSPGHLWVESLLGRSSRLPVSWRPLGVWHNLTAPPPTLLVASTTCFQASAGPRPQPQLLRGLNLALCCLPQLWANLDSLGITHPWSRPPSWHSLEWVRHQPRLSWPWHRLGRHLVELFFQLQVPRLRINFHPTFLESLYLHLPSRLVHGRNVSPHGRAARGSAPTPRVKWLQKAWQDSFPLQAIPQPGPSPGGGISQSPPTGRPKAGKLPPQPPPNCLNFSPEGSASNGLPSQAPVQFQSAPESVTGPTDCLPEREPSPRRSNQVGYSNLFPTPSGSIRATARVHHSPTANAARIDDPLGVAAFLAAGWSRRQFTSCPDS